jgi:hypothetical protein
MSVFDSIGRGAAALGKAARSPEIERLATLPSGSDFMLTNSMHWLGKTKSRTSPSGVPVGVPGLTFRMARIFDDAPAAEQYAGGLSDDVMAVTTSPDGRVMVVLKGMDDYDDVGMATMTDAAGNRITGPAEGMDALFDSGGLAGLGDDANRGVLGALSRNRSRTRQ